jgi:ketosteroid isomerase-like protein
MLFRFKILAIFLVLCGVGCLRKGPSEEELLEKANAIDSALDEAYNKHDLDAFLKHYLKTSDLVVVDGGKFFNGYDAWRKEIQGQFDKIGSSPVKFLLGEKHNIAKGDHVYGYGHYKVVIPVKDAPDTVINGLYTSVKAYQDGELVTVMETYTHAK